MSIINDKDQYGRFRLNQEMNPGKDFTKCVYGNENELDNIDPSKLFDIYKDIINNNPIDIFVVGDVCDEKVQQLFLSKFNFKNRKALPKYIPEKTIPCDVKHINEPMNVKQRKLNIGFKTGITATDDDYFNLMMFNAILGGTVNSKLFMNVREKASLCYYVMSYVDKFNAQLIICTGIDIQNYQKAYDIIKEQIKAIADNDITDSEFDAAVRDFKGKNRAINDSAYSMIMYYYSNMMAGLNISPEEYTKAIENVKKENIHKMASKIYEDTVYFLTSKQEEQ